MIAPPFPPCRHRAEATSDVGRCVSPRLVGLKMVTPELCADCACRDHPPSDASPHPPRLVPCAHRSSAISDHCSLITYSCSHPDHGRATDADCRCCPDYLFPALTPRTPVEMVRRLALLPPRPQPDGWWQWPNVQEAQRRLAAAVAADPPPYPGHDAERGVVIAGGGKYLVAAYVTVRVLRHVGCTLPIQLWHLRGEVDSSMRRLLGPLGVECVDAGRLSERRPFRWVAEHWWPGWQLKAYALAYARFREVLFLDADCYPARDPTFLFDHRAYRRRRAVFWPDIQTSWGLFTRDRWALFGLRPSRHRPLESGQMLIDRESCWGELNVALHYNAQADYVYRHLWGDKDTFLLAWRLRKRPFATLWPECGWDTHTLVQKDDRGEPLFLHRCRDKWRMGSGNFASSPQLTTENRYTPSLPHEDFCFSVLRELAARRA